MLSGIPIRIRFTLLVVLLLTSCCAGLTVILNLSAYKMADFIDAVQLMPATAIGESQGAERSPAVTLTPVITGVAAKKEFRTESIFYMLIMIAIGGGFTYIMAGKLLSPLEELNCQMKNRTIHNLSEDIPIPKTHDEIADLTSSFNEMSAKLNDAFLMQKRFSQNAAHELRTPLSVLKTKADVFKKREHPTQEEYDALIEVVVKHTQRLSGLVKDLLDMTDMTDMTDMAEQPFSQRISLYTAAQEVMEDLELPAKEQRVTLAVQGEDVWIAGNGSLLRRACCNLVENAIRYNNPGGSVNVWVGTREDQAILRVADTGIGIPQELQSRIFEPFFRVDRSRSRASGGAGLGLAMVKDIIEQHGGTITAAQNSPAGTVFQVSIPLLSEQDNHDTTTSA